MKIANAMLIALLASGLAHAHGDEKHAAPQQAEKGGHAAALGKPGDPARVSRTVTVSMSDAMRYNLASIRVKQGETIRFLVKNEGKLKHEMVLGTAAELREHAELMRKFPEMEHDDPNAVSVEPGQTGELVWHFSKAGNFDFGCLVLGHFEAGMRGKLSVTGK
jgi:uncharacterized cupredoxin-like copper-binding protein